MELKDCTYGRMVKSSNYGVGFIVGLTYNSDIRHMRVPTNEELIGVTIPMIKFVTGEKAIHPANLEVFKD